MSWRISFDIIGDTFSPKGIDFGFDTQNEPTDIADSGRCQGQSYGYGSASYIIPLKISRKEAFQHLADLFEPLLDSLKEQGAESWHIHIDRMYYGQCNEELGLEELTQIARLKCPIAYSAYQVSSEEEEKQGFDRN